MASIMDSGSSHENLAYLSSELRYLDVKDKYKWFGTFEELVTLLTILLEVEDGGELSEDQAHKMFTYKVNVVIVKMVLDNKYSANTRSGLCLTARKSRQSLFSERRAARPSWKCANDNRPYSSARRISALAHRKLRSSTGSRSSIPQSNEDACKACSTIKSDLSMLEQQFNELCNLVLAKINMEIGVSTPKGIDLQKENNDLRKDLNMLRSQLEAKNALLAESNAKIKNLENKRDSLITALKLVSDDQANAAPHHQPTLNATFQVNSCLYNSRPLSCGVPQGSILGPLLFLIYINDLPCSLNLAKARMFADNTNITTFLNHRDILKHQKSVKKRCFLCFFCQKPLLVYSDSEIF